MLRKIGVVPFFTNFFWCLAYGHSWNDFSQPNLWVDRSRSFFTDFFRYVSYRQFWSNFVLFVFLQKSSGSSFARFAKNSKSWYLPIFGRLDRFGHYDSQLGLIWQVSRLLDTFGPILKFRISAERAQSALFAEFAKNSKSWYLPINGSIGSVWPLWFSIRTTLTSFTAFRHICPDFKISANHGFLAAGLLAAGFLAAGFLASWLLPSFLE